MTEPAVKRKKLMRNVEERLFNEADNDRMALMLAYEKYMGTLKNLHQEVGDHLTWCAVQECSSVEHKIEETKQLVHESRKRYNELNLVEIMRIDLIGLKILNFIPLQDILNLRVISRRMKDDVTRLLVGCSKFNIWSVGLKSLQIVPPAFFMTALTNLRVSFDCSSHDLTPLQIDNLSKLGPRIETLQLVSKPRFNLIDINVNEICRLKSLHVRCGKHGKNLPLLLHQSCQSLERIYLEMNVGETKRFSKLSCKFVNLTYLRMCFGDSKNPRTAELDWLGFVSLVNNAPLLKSLKLDTFGMCVTKESVARCPQIKLDKLESLEMPVARDRIAGYLHIMRACRNNLQYLTIDVYYSNEEFWRCDWNFPELKCAVIKSPWPYFSMDIVKPHFSENVVRCQGWD